MKKILLFITLLFVFTLSVKADSNLVIEGYKTIGVNTTSELDAIVNDEIDYTNYSKWESSNENVATVDNSGVVTGLQLGKSTISAKCLNSSSLSVIKGDVNYDGVLNHKDITRIGKYLSNIEEFSQAQLLVGDVNGDNIVDSTDSDLINDNTGENAPGGESPLGTIDLQHNTNGIALYFDSYTTEQNLETASYDIEVVDSIKSVSIDDVIAEFRQLPYFTETLSDYNGSIVRLADTIIISYTVEDKNIIFTYDVVDGVLRYDTGEINSDEDAGNSFANAFMLSLLTESILKAAGYSDDITSRVILENATLEKNGIEINNYGESQSFYSDGWSISGTSFVYTADLNHIYIPDELLININDDYYSDIDFDSIENVIETNQVLTNTTKQEAIDNPKTGISLPVVGLGAMLLVSLGSIYYTNKKKAFIKF